MYPPGGRVYIIKAEHPDYYPEYVDCTVRYVARNPYVDARHHEMRRRPYASFADRSLGEVVVKATKIRVAYRGDTVVYNADAFNLSEGRCSMNWSASCPERN